MLALNAAVFPYQGRVHDATLYSFQTLNRVSGGHFSEDLFFKYGSQDRFSVFAPVVSPITAALGLEATFFLLYLVSVVLLYWACLRLSREILGPHAALALCGILLAVSPLWFGGLHIFRVNEAFLTPRLPACALSILAIEQVLKGRALATTISLAMALSLHPLMAGPAVVVCAMYVGWTVIRDRRSSVRNVAIAMAAAAGLAAIWLAGRYAPVLDETWRAIIRQASPYNFPDDWNAVDFAWIAMSLSVVGAAAYELRRDRQELSHVLWACVIAAAGGLGLTWIASLSTHSLLFQIQPYRALWLLRLLHIPCGLLLIARRWSAGGITERFTALAIAVSFVVSELPGIQLQLTLFLLPIAFVVVLLALPRLGLGDRLWRTAALSVAAGVLGLVTMGVAYLVTQRSRLLAEFDPMMYGRLWLMTIGPFWLLIGTGCALFVTRFAARERLVRTGLVVAFVVVHIAAVSIPSTRAYRTRFFPEDVRNLEFVKAQIDSRKDSASPVTIYMDWGSAGDAWMELKVSTYFHLTQVVGVLFSRNTAIEGVRRAALVAPFEVHRYEQEADFQPQIVRLMVTRLFGATPGVPTLAALKRLCADGGVDYAVLKESAIPAESITNGSINIFNCHQLRSDAP